MTHTARFSLFSQALDDMRFWAEHAARVEGRPLIEAAAGAIERGIRFYLPEANNVLEGRLIDDDLKAGLRLPFDCTVILSETTLRGPGFSEACWKLTIAIEPNGAVDRSLHLFGPRFAPTQAYRFAMLSALLTSQHPRWMLTPGAVFCTFPRDAPGYRLVAADTGLIPESQALALINEFRDDASTAMNLCALLGLHNVQRRDLIPSDALTKRRRKRRQQPLLSYHVLEVDGEVWDRPVSDGDGTGGSRSHLRRGHIRRLDDGNRRVWVRATYVRGRDPGFVAKDYTVS